MSHKEVQNRADIVSNNLDEMCHGVQAYQVETFDDNCVRIVTSLDNPWAMVKLFLAVGGQDLAQQYVNKTAVTLDVKA